MNVITPTQYLLGSKLAWQNTDGGIRPDLFENHLAKLVVDQRAEHVIVVIKSNVRVAMVERLDAGRRFADDQIEVVFHQFSGAKQTARL